MVRRKARMKRDAEQAGIVPALALVVDVDDQFFLRRIRGIFKGPDASFALPHAQFIRARHKRQPDGICENQIRERDDSGPVAGNARRGFGHRAIEKRADFVPRVEAVRFCICRKNKTAQQNEGRQPLAVF